MQTIEKQPEALAIAEEARSAEYIHPSFGAQLFMGKFSSPLLLPFPTQDENDKLEGDQIIDPLLEYLKENLDPEEVDANRTIPKHVIQELKDRGIFALKVPKEYNGLGFSQANYNRLVMAVAAYCGGTAVLISAHQSIGVPQPLKMYGTEEQKKRFFPRFREGSISAFALTEPDVGSDPAKMTAEAKLSEDGTHYILNGTKLWCTNGTLADIIVVMAKTAPKNDRKQITAFILEMNTRGVEVTHRCEFMGLGGIYNAVLTFTDVKIPVENVLWGEGRGLALALGTINVGRLTLPAACTGGAKVCLAVAREWGKNRVQWGQPVGLHEPGREKISDIAATTLAMEAVTWLTTHWSDEGKVDIRIEAAMAKMFCTEELWRLTDVTMQLRGGRGYEKARSLKARGEPAYPVERMMRDCRINRILEGSTEIMKLFLAREALDPHIKFMKKGFRWGTVGFYLKWYLSLWIPSWKRHGKMGALAGHFRYVDRGARKLARTIFHSMIRHGPALEKHQLLLGRLMEIGTELFVMGATCSYAQSKNEGVELADFFCKRSKRKIRQLYASLKDNDDRLGNKIAKDVLDDKMRWLEVGVMPIPPQTES